MATKIGVACAHCGGLGSAILQFVDSLTGAQVIFPDPWIHFHARVNGEQHPVMVCGPHCLAEIAQKLKEADWDTAKIQEITGILS